MPRPSDDYYRNLPAKIGPVLSEVQYKEVEELGLLVDRDDQVSQDMSHGDDSRRSQGCAPQLAWHAASVGQVHSRLRGEFRCG